MPFWSFQLIFFSTQVKQRQELSKWPVTGFKPKTSDVKRPLHCQKHCRTTLKSHQSWKLIWLINWHFLLVNKMMDIWWRSLLSYTVKNNFHYFVLKRCWLLCWSAWFNKLNLDIHNDGDQHKYIILGLG